MHFFIAYDISDDRLRLRIANTLERHGGVRVQRSLFFLDSFRQKELARLRADLFKELADGKVLLEDTILCIPVEQDLLKGSCWLGCPPSIENVGKRPLVIIW